MRATTVAPCAVEPCHCGDCYQPHSLVGDWLGRRLRRARAFLRTRMLRRPGSYGPDGHLQVPVWVYEVFSRDG